MVDRLIYWFWPFQKVKLVYSASMMFFIEERMQMKGKSLIHSSSLTRYNFRFDAMQSWSLQFECQLRK